MLGTFNHACERTLLDVCAQIALFLCHKPVLCIDPCQSSHKIGCGIEGERVMRRTRTGAPRILMCTSYMDGVSASPTICAHTCALK